MVECVLKNGRMHTYLAKNEGRPVRIAHTPTPREILDSVLDVIYLKKNQKLPQFQSLEGENNL